MYQLPAAWLALAYLLMYIFIDESGTFLPSPERDSWCVVAAYVIPEHLRRKVDALMLRVRGIGNNGAVTKLKHISDGQYVWILAELNKLGGIAFATNPLNLPESDAITINSGSL